MKLERLSKRLIRRLAPTLDLIEPRSMFRDVDKANPMVGVGQESGAGFHRLEDATLVA